jgi:hypothetical protein
MSAAADDLVGRGQALAVIDRVLDAVAGRAGLPGRRGEPGIGKTSMMERLSELANGLGVGSRVEVARTVERARG